MASNGTGQRPGSSSFLTYMVGQRAKAGRGLQEIDNAIGTPIPNANANAGKQQTPDAVVPPDATQAQPPEPPAASNPPLTLNGPEMTETQPGVLSLNDTDRFYRDNGRLPLAADLAAQSFEKQFREQSGRPPTKAEMIAHLYRSPELLPQVSQDYTT